MTGLLLISVALIWLGACIWLTSNIARRLPDKWWRPTMSVLVFGLLLILPLIDELISMPQFETQCREKANLIIDKPSGQKRTAWFGDGERTQISIGLLNATVHRLQYVEPTSGELVYHYSTITPDGGWLVHALAISETNSPLLFRSICAPEQIPNLREWLKERLITEIPRPISN